MTFAPILKLCIDCRMLDSSGIGTFLKNLIPFFRSPSFQTTLILNPKTSSKFENGFRYLTCDIPIYTIKEQLHLPQLIPESDLFWSPHYNIPLSPIRSKRRIVTIHDACHLAFAHSLGWKEKMYARFMLNQAVSRSDFIVTDSKFSQAELSRYLSVPKNKIHVIYPGVNISNFSHSYSQQAQSSLVDKYSLPPHFYLFVGNIKPHKNLKLVLDAYDNFSIDAPLVVVGKRTGLIHLDPALNRIASSKTLRSKILFTDNVEDSELPLFYQLAIALIFPSLYEGFGLPPLEAMAAGCPVIASNAASLPEVCGDAALMIPPTDSKLLAEAMQLILNTSLRSTLRERGFEQVKKFSWENTGKQYINLIDTSHEHERSSLK